MEVFKSIAGDDLFCPALYVHNAFVKVDVAVEQTERLAGA